MGRFAALILQSLSTTDIGLAKQDDENYALGFLVATNDWCRPMVFVEGPVVEYECTVEGSVGTRLQGR
jgi:hypothetical protein